MALDDATVKDLTDALKRFNASRSTWRSYGPTIVGWALGTAVTVAILLGPVYCGDREAIRRNAQKNEEQDKVLSEHDRRIGAAQVTADTAAAQVERKMSEHITSPLHLGGRR